MSTDASIDAALLQVSLLLLLFAAVLAIVVRATSKSLEARPRGERTLSFQTRVDGCSFCGTANTHVLADESRSKFICRRCAALALEVLLPSPPEPR